MHVNMKRYVALLTQVDTNPPTAQVMVNTFNQTPTFIRNGEGAYYLRIEGELPDQERAIINITQKTLTGLLAAGMGVEAAWFDIDQVEIRTGFINGPPADGELHNTPIVVEVYP